MPLLDENGVPLPGQDQDENVRPTSDQNAQTTNQNNIPSINQSTGSRTNKTPSQTPNKSAQSNQPIPQKFMTNESIGKEPGADDELRGKRR